MNAGSTHTKNSAMGWDIAATGKADTGENIQRAQVLVNGSSEYDESFDPPISSWQASLDAQGQFPGNNTVQVILSSDKGDDTQSVDAWG